MENRIWQPLGRLSYCAYIVHSFVIHYIFNLDDRPAHFVSIWQTYVHRVIPIVVASYVFAFVWSCLFEVPFSKIDKMLIGPITPRRDARVCNELTPVEKKTKPEENGDLRI
ncbi:hypothetical protein OESDEN_25085 [Oesophagostomum dentatum]|uniref:Acyltransferase 3 domain-containing protein n=1 Tax=Oesophagostomum dentatum TaxID=61180 RepID=A0A0B1RRM8_OESDE|nr:hypothetical protein OESDEN_25085 [Oesophagostomum dentatum]